MSRKLLTLAALAVSISALSGCGSVGVPNSGTALQAQTQQKVEAKDHNSVSRAKQIATDALYRYDALLDRWHRAQSDSEKDRIEQQMLNRLTSAITDVRQEASNGSGYSARRVYDIADGAISRYEDLRYRWEQASSDSEKREIVNEMLTLLTRALKSVQGVR